MKTFYLIRHAKSSWEDMSLRDFDRPLNKRGLRDAPFMSKMLAGKGVKADAIVSSPANRALTTAAYFAEAMGIKKEDIIQEKNIYEAYPDTVLEIIELLDDSLNTVLVFGHNPTFTSLANDFKEDGYIANLPTCGIVKIESKAKKWEDVSVENSVLTEFYFPKQYF